MGLGWLCAGKDDNFRFGHDGADEGFLSRIRLVPAKGQGAVVMINSVQGWPLLDELFDAIGHEYAWPAFEELPKRLAAAAKPEDRAHPPGLRLHQLRGARADTWSLTVTGNWRLTFRFEGGNALDFDFEDYH